MSYRKEQSMLSYPKYGDEIREVIFRYSHCQYLKV